jgi:HK97 family phage portal protein
MGVTSWLNSRLGLFPDNFPEPNGNGHKAADVTPRDTAAPSVSTLPEQRKAAGVSFIGDERTIVRLLGGLPIDAEYFDFKTVRGRTAYVAAALAYICINYRAKKIIEAPLYVAEEQADGRDKWIRPHEIDRLLRKPNPDMGMKRMLEAVEVYLLTTGRALFVKNRTNAQQTASMYPFSGDEFTVEPDSAKTRLYGKFRINGSGNEYKPEQVVFFQYFHPTDPWAGMAPLDAALNALNIGQTLQHRVKHTIKNAFSAGALYILDKEAGRLTDEEFERAKGELNAVTRGLNSGTTAIIEGGGRVERGWSLGDYQLGELWREIEAQVCGCFNVRPELIGTVVGLENSPWSHIKTAKEMFYDECIIPEWDFIADALSDQLLPEFDQSPDRYIRFDTSRVRALQKDLAQQALIASAVSRFTSVNERRMMIGQEPSAEEGADDIPELNAPVMPGFGVPAGDEDEEEEEEEAEGEKRRWPHGFRTKARRQHRYAIYEALTQSAADTIALAAGAALEQDRITVVRIMEDAAKATNRQAVRSAQQRADDYLRNQSQLYWTSTVGPHIQSAAERAAALMAADLGLNAQLLNEDVLKYAQKEAGWLVKGVSKTTREAIGAAITDGLLAGEGATQIASRLRDLPAFTRDRAILVGRTESTRVTNGAPMEALSDFGGRTGQKFIKTWFAVLDSRVRDEHEAMNGEQVPIDQPFSNGSMAPDEPNCRCTLLYGSVDTVQASRRTRPERKASDVNVNVNVRSNPQEVERKRSVEIESVERDPATQRITKVNFKESVTPQ